MSAVNPRKICWKKSVLSLRVSEAILNMKEYTSCFTHCTLYIDIAVKSIKSVKTMVEFNDNDIF